jgi:hypothetical protein
VGILSGLRPGIVEKEGKMPQHISHLMVPPDLADILVDEGAARTTFERRSEILRILGDGATTASIAITLLQGPAAILQTARGIKRWACAPKRADPDTGKLTFESREGKVELVVHRDTEIGLIVEVLQQFLLRPSENQPPGDQIDGLTV